MARYPDVRDAELVGTYPVQVGAGGGYVWDEVLEYRVWCSPELGAPDVADGSDCFYPLASFEEAAKDARRHRGAESPLALVLQKEYVEEAEEGVLTHVRQERLTEWPVDFLARPRRTDQTIPADRDRHKGEFAWKGASTSDGLRLKSTRSGTYSWDLRRRLGR